MENNYTITHLHSDFSNGTTNIDSVTKFNHYIEKARECGMKAIAFTEHGNIFNWFKKKGECEKNGLKYIHSVEMYITETIDEKIRDNYHCCLYAKNKEGFFELNKLVSQAGNRDNGSYYYVPRITFEQLISTSNNIIIATACLGGILNKGKENIKIYSAFVEFLRKNKHRCFLEIQHHNVKDQAEYNKELYKLSKEIDIPLITGTDTHALDDRHVKGRAILQLSKNIHFGEEDEWDLTFKTYDELVECYKIQNSLPMDTVLEAINNTNVLADMVESFEIDLSPKYPQLYSNPIDVFKKKINEGVIARGINKYENYKEEYLPRIYEEFEVYKKVNSINYMLLQEKITTESKLNGGVEFGYGRGSVNGSLIAYILGITETDSIKYKLNFYRFMNPDRVSMPDIDGDHGDKDRDWVKNYIFNMEGVYTCDIITFNTVALKGSIRDVGRALKMDLNIIDEISKNIDDNEDYYREKYPELFEYVDIINGAIVSIGSHPAGVVVSPIPLDENVGLCTLGTNPNPVSVIDMKGIDGMSFVKLDILGLDTIGIINETCKLVGIDRYTPDNIDLKDKEVWKSIKADTTSIFQFESDMAHKYLQQILSEESFNKIKKKYPSITEFDLFMFVNAAIRPAGENFRDEATMGECNSTGIKELDDMLFDTLGYVLLQEQIMQFLVDFCNYSNAESDNVRRAIGKKLGTEELLPEIKRRFLEYSPSKYNIDGNKALEIIDPFIETVKSASDYGFSKNHNVPYAITGYVAGYLRHYYPLEFICSSLNVWTRKKKPEDIVSVTEYANKTGIKITEPKFRYSKSDYFINKKDNTIVKGIESIKYLNKEVGEYLYSLKDNQYDTFTDLLKDLQGHINSKQLNILVLLDFFSEFGKTDKLLKTIDNYNNILTKKQFKKDKLSCDIDILRQYANKETEKTISDVNTYDLCKYLENQLEDIHVHISKRIEANMEYVGSCNITDKSYGKRHCVITSINTKYTPVVTAYNIHSGRTADLRIAKKLFKNNPVKQYDTICLLDTENKPRKRKTDTGYETVPNEFNLYATEYFIVG